MCVYIDMSAETLDSPSADWDDDEHMTQAILAEHHTLGARTKGTVSIVSRHNAEAEAENDADNETENDVETAVKSQNNSAVEQNPPAGGTNVDNMV